MAPIKSRQCLALIWTPNPNRLLSDRSFFDFDAFDQILQILIPDCLHPSDQSKKITLITPTEGFGRADHPNWSVRSAFWSPHLIWSDHTLTASPKSVINSRASALGSLYNRFSGFKSLWREHYGPGLGLSNFKQQIWENFNILGIRKIFKPNYQQV